MESDSFILEDKLVKTLRTKDRAWDFALALAEIATQFSGGSERMCAIEKLHRLNPRLRIDTRDGRRYLHGEIINGVDAWVPISAVKSQDYYLRLFDELEHF